MTGFGGGLFGHGIFGGYAIRRALDLRLVAYAPNGERLGVMPDPTSLTVSFPHNDVGALTVDYSSLAAGGHLLERGLDEGLEIAVEVAARRVWVEPDNGRFVLIKRSRDRLDRTRTISLTLPAYGWLATKARNLDTEHLLPPEHTQAGKRPFYSATGGEILATLHAENAARGGIPMQCAFTPTHDSEGMPWASVLTIYYELGLDLAAIRDNLTEQGVIDWRTRGRDLCAWNPDGVCAPDLSDTVRLHLHRDVTEAPEEESIEEVVGRVLIRGEDGLTITEDNPAAPDPWGVWEGFISQGGVADEGTARALVQAELARGARIRGSYTRGLVLPGARFLPMIDYAPGAWITAPTATPSGERVRVQQITLTKTGKGVSGNVVLNDRLLDAELRRAKRMRGIVGGATAGGTGARPTPEGPDRRTPSAPTGVVVSSSAYIDPDGAPRGILDVTWDPVTTATDGSALEVAYYWVAVREDELGAPYAIRALSDASTHIALSPFDVGKRMVVRVCAIGKYTGAGDWSEPVVVVVADDTTPPPVPSDPVVTSRLGTVTIAWDGLDADGNAMPRDLDRVDVWQESTGTVVGSLRARVGLDFIVITDMAYGTTDRWRLQAVDRSGNTSDMSGWVEAGVVPLVDTDLIGQVIDAAHIVDGTLVASEKVVAESITGALIQALAIEAGHIAANAITADKIDAGAIQAVHIAAGAIEAGHLKAGAVTAASLDADAITGKTITGGTINGSTIMGGKITASGGLIVEHESGIRFGTASGPSIGWFSSIITADGSLGVTGNFFARGGLSGQLSISVDADSVSVKHLSATNTANCYLGGSGNFATIFKSTSLARFKLDREPIGLHYAILDLPPQTWRDAGEVERDPTTQHRVAGFVAEELEALSAEHGGVFDPLLMRDDDGTLQGIAYDRVLAYLLPVVADLARRVDTIESTGA